jgi:hypothetical protein
MARFDKTAEPDKPSNFCGKCRKWVESNERINVFYNPETGEHPYVWNCPACRPSEANVTVA